MKYRLTTNIGGDTSTNDYDKALDMFESMCRRMSDHVNVEGGKVDIDLCKEGDIIKSVTVMRNAVFFNDPLTTPKPVRVMKTGIELITAERQEQIEKHGRTVEKDVEYNHGKYVNHDLVEINAPQLILAAGWLIRPENDGSTRSLFRPFGWDRTVWFKMLNKPYKERLVIAGALIAAEIDRIQFIETTPKP